MTLSLALCAQLLIAAAVGAGLVAACRWVQRRSRLCGWLVVAGLLLRATVTFALFWTSYLNLPILRHLHTGDGFWKLAIDARIYYYSAVNAAQNGLDTVLRGSPSPAFVKGLALWMRAVGPSQMSAAYLNLSLYVLLCLLIVAWFKPTGKWREDLPCAVTLAAVSFSPVLIVYGSQPLKDTMFVFLLGIVCVAAFELMPVIVFDGGVTRRSRVVNLGLAATFLAALYLIAGIRGYYGLLTWSALAWVLFVFAWRQRPARLVGYIAVSVLVLTAVWVSYMTGADFDYINPYGNPIAATWAATHPETSGRSGPGEPGATRSMLSMVDAYRAGFVLTPGATNIGSGSMGAGQMENGVPSPITRGSAAPLPGTGLRDRLSAVTLGLGLMFVPVSALRALSIVNFTGGRGLLAITDADTLLMDLTIVAAFALLVRRRSAVRDRLPYVCFMGTLSIAAALLMAYIVTNFGTLFRLRLMVSVPLWMLPLALSPPAPRRDGAADEDRQSVEPPVTQDSAGSAGLGMGTRTGLVDLLVCPTCAGRFRTEGDGVEGTVLRCASCGLVVPIRQGIPRFMEDLRDRSADPVARLAARTQASFGYEWTYFHRWHDSGETSFHDYFETADLSEAR
ncbi:MAG TPA: hypothetical protein VF921_17695, partial [Vicinamibacterales bacterium]